MAILLAPGFMLDADLWTDMADALGEFGPLRFIDLSQDDTIERMAARALGDAPPSFLLVGFSMGGYVAREIARRSAGRVSALVLIATSARGDTRERAERKRLAAARLSAAPYKGVSRSAIARALHPSRAGDEATVERIRAMSIRLGADVFMRQSTLDRRGDLALLGEVHCPTLILAGAEDRLRSLAEAEELRDGIAGAELRIIAGVGHMIPIEAPAALTAAMRPWLRARLNCG